MTAYHDVPFSFFCYLVRDIASYEPKTVTASRNKSTSWYDYDALNKFKKWVKQLREKYPNPPPGTTAICFKFLFPEEDVRRKYHIQEKCMVKNLADCLGKQRDDFDAWNQDVASGCLGLEVQNALAKSSMDDDDHRSDFTLSEVDTLLDELAALSPYSHSSITAKYPKRTRRKREVIFKSLFRRLSPLEAGVVTQIILKDMKPLLYPLSEFHYRVALINFNTNAVRMMTLANAMYAWDWSSNMANFYRVRASLDEAAAFSDDKNRSMDDIVPKVGVRIAIPKSEKGMDCTKAINHFAGSSYVWAETKYDGERAQIHVRVGPNGPPKIQIFSKSGRESTHDRDGVHHVIRAALGLVKGPNENCATKKIQNVILDAEMVAFGKNRIEEFWHIRQLIAQTAVGVRNKQPRKAEIEDSYEHESMRSSDADGLSLGLVFFDVLYLNGESLLHKPYKERRATLESLITTIPGQAILAARYRVDMLSVSKPNRRALEMRGMKLRSTSEDKEAAAARLCWIFAEHIASFEEGLVLKADDSRYNDWNKQWVKLKKDYIPGYGDCVDMVVLGASWEKERARTLRVPPSVYTTFYVGVLVNKKAMEYNSRLRPSFHIYFTVSYGLKREELEEVNFLIKNSDSLPYDEYEKHTDRPFDITVLSTLPKPAVILQTPLICKLFGAGFTKAEHSHHYELRFPRISKYYRPSLRKWQDGVDSEELYFIACASVGRDSSDWVIDKEMRELFTGEPPSPGVRCPKKKERVAEEWFDKLSRTEGKPGRRRPAEEPLDDTMALVVPRPLGPTTPPRRGRMVGTGRKESPLSVDTDDEDLIEFAKPLSTRTNVDDSPPSDGLMYKGEPVMSPEPVLRLAIGQTPITPPASSPLRHEVKDAEPSGMKRARSPSPKRGSRKLLKLSSPQIAPADPSREKLELSIPEPSSLAQQTLPSPESETEPEVVAAEAKPEKPAYPPGVELDSTFAFFARPPGKYCEQYRAWRHQIPRPIHSLSAIKTGCGWTPEGLGHRKRGVQGIIIVDECDRDGAAAWLERIRTELHPALVHHERLPIRVYGCRNTTTPLLEFQ